MASHSWYTNVYLEVVHCLTNLPAINVRFVEESLITGIKLLSRLSVPMAMTNTGYSWNSNKYSLITGSCNVVCFRD